MPSYIITGITKVERMVVDSNINQLFGVPGKVSDEIKQQNFTEKIISFKVYIEK